MLPSRKPGRCWAIWATRSCAAPLKAVAQRQSQGIDATEGGYHDWTSRGSLASETLDQAIFTLPVGRLSERLEDSEGFHIVRVIERTEAGRVPFEQAQVDIKETLRKEHIKSQITAYVAKLKQEIPVWTAFDDQAPAPATARDRPAAPEAAHGVPTHSPNGAASWTTPGNEAVPRRRFRRARECWAKEFSTISFLCPPFLCPLFCSLVSVVFF